MSPRLKTNSHQSAKDYEQLGRLISTTYLTGELDRKQLIKNSFLKGLMAGFGGVIGATIVVAFLLWILAVLNHVPLVGPVFDNVQDTIETRR